MCRNKRHTVRFKDGLRFQIVADLSFEVNRNRWSTLEAGAL